MEKVNQQKQQMILRTLTQLLTENQITLEEFQKLLDVQTRILERILAKVAVGLT